MRLCKKSLAIVLSLCLLLTAISTCFIGGGGCFGRYRTAGQLHL